MIVEESSKAGMTSVVVLWVILSCVSTARGIRSKLPVQNVWNHGRIQSRRIFSNVVFDWADRFMQTTNVSKSDSLINAINFTRFTRIMLNISNDIDFIKESSFSSANYSVDEHLFNGTLGTTTSTYEMLMVLWNDFYFNKLISMYEVLD